MKNWFDILRIFEKNMIESYPQDEQYKIQSYLISGFIAVMKKKIDLCNKFKIIMCNYYKFLKL